MKIDTRALAIGVVAAAGAFVVFRGGSGSAGDGDPASAIPKESFLAATIDLAELRRSPVYDAVFGKDGAGAEKALGVGKLADACGFDPLGRVGRLAVAVPEEGDSGDFGIAAKITVSRDEIAKCTRGVSSGEPKEVGSFGVVETDGKGRASLAYGKDGLLVVSRGRWFGAMLAAAEGAHPSIAASQEHQAIRTSLTRREGWSAPTIVMSALLPADLREKLRHEMRAELGSQDSSAAAMGGVLGVSGVGVALRTGSRMELAAELVCDTPDACTAVEKLIQKKRLDLSKELSLRMIGLGPLVDSLDTAKEDAGKRVRVTAHADARQLADTIERLLRLRGARKAAAAQQEDADPAPRKTPDETIRPDAGMRDGPL